RGYVVKVLWKLTEWDQACAITGEIGNLPFMRLTHVNNRHLLPAIEFVLQLAWGDLPLSDHVCGRCRRHPAELIKINQALPQRTLAVRRTLTTTAQPQLAELHLQGIEQQQPPDERLAFVENQFHRFRCLNHPNNPRQNTEHAPLTKQGT